MSDKPLGGRSYGSIAHLPCSRLGPGDHSVPDGMQRIATQKARSQHERVIVQEKLDGTNVGVAKLHGKIVALQRAGYRAETSPRLQHQLFAEWVEFHRQRFDELLVDGERLCGEWLIQAHATRYDLPHEPFVAFDLMQGTVRLPYQAFVDRVTNGGFVIPALIHAGPPCTVQEALDKLGAYGFHGAQDQVEGAVWRIEINKRVRGTRDQRTWQVDFLTKYVRPDKVDGCYLPEISGTSPVWNVTPEQLRDSFSG